MLDKKELLLKIIEIENRELKGLIEESLYLKKIEIFYLTTNSKNKSWNQSVRMTTELVYLQTQRKLLAPNI